MNQRNVDKEFRERTGKETTSLEEWNDEEKWCCWS